MHINRSPIRRQVLGAAMLALSVAALGACGGDDDSAATTVAAPAATAAASPTTVTPAATATTAPSSSATGDVCTLATADEVGQVLGISVVATPNGFGGCDYGDTAADIIVAVQVYPAAYYDGAPGAIGKTPTSVPGLTDGYQLTELDVVMKWGDQALEVTNLSISDSPVDPTVDQLVAIGELVRAG